MKKRLLISLIITAILLISFTVVIPLMDPSHSIIYSVFAVITLVLAMVYLFSGLAKLTVMSIYSVVIVVLLILLPDYQHAIIAIGTLTIILNPLANFETYLEKILKDDDTSPLRISIRGSYWPFYGYRQEMKNYVRLPQTKKLYTKVWYLRIRQLTTLGMLFAAIFLFINELKNIYIDLLNYNLVQMFTFYGVVSLFMLTFILYKKGFTAMFRTGIMFLFIPMIFVLWIAQISFTLKIIFTAVFALLGAFDIVYEKFASLNRVAYRAYKYYDSTDNRFVYANEFYEPFVYNETYNLVGMYKFKASVETFEKNLHEILFYSNRKHFMITAYTYDGTNIMVYTEFYHKHAKRAEKFKVILESLFHTKVYSQIVYDKNKQIYETTFFHKNEYIVARALALTELLNEIDLENKEIIISIIFSFKSLEDIQALSKLYYVQRLEDLDDEDYFAARVSVRSTNSKFAIEQKVRDVLLNAMIYRATYVRILVYYEGGNKYD